MRQSEKAIRYWRLALECDPVSPAYHGKLAALLAETGAWEQAREQCQTWLRLDPGSFDARRLLIRCLRQLGQRREAQEQIDQLHRLNE
jgi:tetratricopeptide (TPR) repeat protein